MFTTDQIRQAHSKVKSGADFPAYIQDLKKLGVTSYETYLTDGHTVFYGNNDYKTTMPAKYASLAIAETSSDEQFKQDLKAHQHGKTDYPTFCKDAAKAGIEKWVVAMDGMTCTYLDRKGNSLLVERIPQ